MVEVPDPVMSRFVIDCALEWGEPQNQPTTGHARGPDHEIDYSLKSIDPSSCNVEYVNDYYVVVHGAAEGSWTEQVTRAKYNPPGQAHPAEYENHDVQLAVSMALDLTNLGSVEYEIYVA